MNKSDFLLAIQKCLSSDDYIATKIIFDLQYQLSKAPFDKELWAVIVDVINMLRADNQPSLTSRKETLMRAALLNSLSIYVSNTADFDLDTLKTADDRLALLAYAAPLLQQDRLNSLIRESCSRNMFEYFDQEITAALLPYVGPQEKRLLVKRLYSRDYGVNLIKQLIIQYNDVQDSISHILGDISINEELGIAIKDLIPGYTQNVANVLYRIECSKTIGIPEYYISRVAEFLETLTEEELECIRDVKPTVVNNCERNHYKVLSLVADWHEPEALPVNLFERRNLTALAKIIPKLSRETFLALYNSLQNKEVPLIFLNHTCITEISEFHILLKRYLRSSNVDLKLDLPLVEVPPEVVEKLTKKELISLIECSTHNGTKCKFSLDKSVELILRRLSLELLTDPGVGRLYQRFLEVYKKTT